MPPVSDQDLQRLADAARRRRAELGIPLNDATAKAGGLSKHTWQRVEKGLPIRETNYVKIDGLLKWAPGSCLLILGGGEPVLADDVAGAPDVQKSPLPREAVEGRAMDAVQLALIATAKGKTAEEIREMSRRVVRDLQEKGLL